MIELQEKDNKTRPELLKILCILTFVGGGLSLISNAFMFLSIDTIREYYKNGAFEFLSKDVDLSALEMLLGTNAIYFLVQAALFAAVIYGAYLMWNLKKNGFHIYTIAQILLLIIPQIFLPDLPFPTFELILSLLFITLYAKNLRFLK